MLSSRWSRYKSLLDFAWGLSSTPVIEVLLDFYAQGKQEDSLTLPQALITAIKRESPELLQLIIDTWLKSDAAKEGEALHFAASMGHIGLLRILLENPKGVAGINDKVPKTGTVLHADIGAVDNALERVQLLLDKGADAEIVSGKFGTTLHTACATGKYDVTELLLDRLPKKLVTSVTGKYGTVIQNGVPTFAVGGNYFTPLHAALIVSSPKEVVDRLTNEANWLMLYLDVVGRLPLHLAIVRGNWDLATEILSLTSQDPSVDELTLGHKDKQGLTGLHYAAISSSPTPIAKIMEQYNKDISDLINEPDHDGWTPLHWACRQRDVEIVKVLIENKANVRAKTDEGWTPRRVATLHGNTDHEYLMVLPDIADGGEGLSEIALYATCDFCYCVSISRLTLPL
ncbi:hypothetical protein MMC11_000035 [Xylographa trunciseda]|nr:hypothetical protein [Xylographa trunciseda]